MKTAGDARREKLANDNRRFPGAPHPTTIERPRHPGVGVLCRDGAPIYYGHVRGIYFESPQLKAVETILEAQELN